MFPIEAGLDNLFHLPFWFAIDDVRWWSFVIWTVGLGLAIMGQEVDMEDRVDLH